MDYIEKYFKIYGEEIYRFLRRFLKDEEIAKDILQETFLKAMKVSLEEEKAKNYLFKIAKNLAIDYLKKERRWVYEEELLEGSVEDPECIIEREDIWRPLNEIEKEILIFYYYKGYSYEEISKKLSIPLNTIKSHIYRAKKKIYNYLQGEKNEL
uniref:RNA polymerase sigma factor n=1 Tax=Dictyoglomus thermophilum TaxID=14 RepID=A0A7C3RSB1_DICTH